MEHSEVSKKQGAVLTQADVAQLADVARIRLSDDELQAYTKSLQDMLASFSALLTLDTTGVPVAGHATPVTNVFRTDEPRPSLDRERVLANAPEPQDGFFRVPRILGEE